MDTTTLLTRWTTFKLKLAGAIKSCTIWFNGIMAMLPSALDYATTQLPLLNSYLPQRLYAWIFVTTILGNMALRFKTNKPLELK